MADSRKRHFAKTGNDRIDENFRRIAAQFNWLDITNELPTAGRDFYGHEFILHTASGGIPYICLKDAGLSSYTWTPYKGGVYAGPFGPLIWPTDPFLEVRDRLEDSAVADITQGHFDTTYTQCQKRNLSAICPEASVDLIGVKWKHATETGDKFVICTYDANYDPYWLGPITPVNTNTFPPDVPDDQPVDDPDYGNPMLVIDPFEPDTCPIWDRNREGNIRGLTDEDHYLQGQSSMRVSKCVKLDDFDTNTWSIRDTEGNDEGADDYGTASCSLSIDTSIKREGSGSLKINRGGKIVDIGTIDTVGDIGYIGTSENRNPREVVYAFNIAESNIITAIDTAMFIEERPTYGTTGQFKIKIYQLPGNPIDKEYWYRTQAQMESYLLHETVYYSLPLLAPGVLPDLTRYTLSSPITVSAGYIGVGFYATSEDEFTYWRCGRDSSILDYIFGYQTLRTIPLTYEIDYAPRTYLSIITTPLNPDIYRSLEDKDLSGMDSINIRVKSDLADIDITLKITNSKGISYTKLFQSQALPDWTKLSWDISSISDAGKKDIVQLDAKIDVNDAGSGSYIWFDICEACPGTSEDPHKIYRRWSTAFNLSQYSNIKVYVRGPALDEDGNPLILGQLGIGWSNGTTYYNLQNVDGSEWYLVDITMSDDNRSHGDAVFLFELVPPSGSDEFPESFNIEFMYALPQP